MEQYVNRALQALYSLLEDSEALGLSRAARFRIVAIVGELENALLSPGADAAEACRDVEDRSIRAEGTVREVRGAPDEHPESISDHRARRGQAGERVE